MRTRTIPIAPIAAAALLLWVLAAGAGCSRAEPAADVGDGEDVIVPVAPEDATMVAARPQGPIARGTSCGTSGCHASLVTGRFVHGVLLAGDGCSTCHEPDQGGHVFPVKRGGSAACTFCHSEVTGRRAHQHGATAVECIACHDPHSSQHASLLRASSASTLCAACHPAETLAVPHGPFATGACTACHDPHESDFDGLLRGGEGAEHCYLCHDETRRAMTEAVRVHTPAARDCAICHAPHGSDHPHVMRKPIDETCFTCHADIEKLVAGATAPHGAMRLDDQCANCHDPHASDRPSLLRERQDELCLRCHDTPIVADDGRTIPDMAPSIRGREFLHGPVKSGQCTACHAVHGGSHSRLLRQTFEERFYVSFDLSHYALCFECHEDDLVTTERTTTLTDFRNGDVNLHYLHVNREKKGRTCRACHEMHGSELHAHVAESVPFEGSGWALPIGFKKTETGGSCAPGCHKPLSYSRTAVIPWPEDAEPAADESEGLP